MILNTLIFSLMKICFVNILCSKEDQSGGLGSHIFDLSKELSRLGHEIVIITSGPRKTSFVSGIKILQMGRTEKFICLHQLFNPLYLFRRLLYMLRATAYILNSDFDIIEAAEGGFEHLFLIHLKKCPIVTKLYGNFKYIYGLKIPLVYFVDKLEKFVTKNSDGIIAPSFSYATTISKDYRIPLEKIMIIPFGINIQRITSFNKTDTRFKYPQTIGKKIVMLSVGDSPQRKGADIFIKSAFKIQQDNIFFILICSDRNKLNFKKMPRNFLLLENLNKSDFYSLISDSEIVVLTSYFESFSIVVREAMMFNKVIIISKNVPLDEAENKYPNLIILKNICHLELAKTISEVNEDRKQLCGIDQKLRAYLIDKYDIRKIAGLTLNFYNETVKNYKESKK